MMLIVQVIDAHDLKPKDGEGSASPFVEVDFQNQLSKTTTVPKNLNPVWNQRLSFHFDKTYENNRHQSIEITVYHDGKSTLGRIFLGRVSIPFKNVVKKGEEVYQKFQLESKRWFSFVKGEVGLKLYISPESEPLKKLEARDSVPRIEASKSATNEEIEVLSEAKRASKPFKKIETSAVVAPLPPDSVPVIEVRSETKRASKPLKKIEACTVIAPLPPDSAPVIEVRSEAKTRESLLVKMQPRGNLEADHDYELKDMNPQLGGRRWRGGGTYGGRGWLGGERSGTTYDLVEQTYHLYVRVVKAKDLASGDPYAEVRLGNYVGRTRHLEHRANPEWNQVFAFSKDRIQSSTLEVYVKDKEMFGRADYLGRVVFDLNEIPTRVPPDSPLAPQWHRMERGRGELMVAVWMGTQADEAFPEAWHSDASTVQGEGVFNVRSKVYVSPKLWYLRVNIIEAQDLILNDNTHVPEVSVKVQVGNQVLRTKICSGRAMNPIWDEDLVFVAAEPFEELLVLTIEDRVNSSRDEVLGTLNLPLTTFEKRLDHRPVHSRWFNVEKYGFNGLEGERRRELKFSSRVHLRACLEGGYHVLDESTLYISDQRPTAKQLWKPPCGILEVGILGAQGLLPMKIKDGRGSTDAYCVAKYGQKWVRTRTILDTLKPKWNEQYTWEVYDPCTVITMGVFDNCHLGTEKHGAGPSTVRDSRIGKIRIRLSTLEANRTYTHSYPLIVLQPSGVKKMGELNLAVRFTTLSMANMVSTYGNPLLPKMHYLHPFTVNQIENLRYQAMNIVSARLGRAEPPLRKEVVEYMLDVDSHMWSMRRSKANFFRLMSLLSGLFSIGRWLNDVCHWKNPVTSVLVHILFLILVWYPELILPTICLYMFLIGLWNYRSRAKHPPHMDPKLSWAEAVHPDELDEEFDTFPTTRTADIVRMRYDRIRSVAGRIQTVVGDVATQGERFGMLLTWRDPRATSLFVFFSLCAAVVLYATPFRVVALVGGLYMFRHPQLRSKLPSVPNNFFRRLPAQTDSLL
ncbi:FT-interacting protein 1-like [Cynara cardunculus var. scolymus]|nr:FT-interacting protein 1-like [Cynara cardunculus var. scolymus]